MDCIGWHKVHLLVYTGKREDLTSCNAYQKRYGFLDGREASMNLATQTSSSSRRMLGFLLGTQPPIQRHNEEQCESTAP
eukprot:scaffold644_cov357-Pavlova_lutheri.AAC.40